MIKFNGKMVPARKVNGEWVPIENAELLITVDDELKVIEKEKKDEE